MGWRGGAARQVADTLSKARNVARDPVRNSHSPGAGTPSPLLTGRDWQLAEIDVATQRLSAGRSARNLLLTGLRSVGKTLLLREFGPTAERRGWVRQQVEATDDRGGGVPGSGVRAVGWAAVAGWTSPKNDGYR